MGGGASFGQKMSMPWMSANIQAPFLYSLISMVVQSKDAASAQYVVQSKDEASVQDVVQNKDAVSA
jgi:hypothetical protein